MEQHTDRVDTTLAQTSLEPDNASVPIPEEARQTNGESEQPDPAAQISCSGGLAAWLVRQQCSIAFTSYQIGQVFLVGVTRDGALSFHQRSFQRAMGICVDAEAQTLHLAMLYQIWRFTNILKQNEVANEAHDRCFTPRQSFTTGAVDAHDIGIDAKGRIVFVNTSYSCLAIPDPVHSFQPLWKPDFISKLVPEDRCHLNGLAMEQGQPRYVTAVCRSDVIQGWRARREQGGMVMDVKPDTVLTENLSMPHSPRIHNGALYVLDSGRGFLCRVDRETGTSEPIAFCPGFLRGLAFHNNHAIVGLSLPRDKSFAGLELDDALQKKDSDPWCGLQIVDLKGGNIVEWIRLSGAVRELFDVAILPSVRCPMALGLMSPDVARTISLNETFATLG